MSRPTDIVQRTLLVHGCNVWDGGAGTTGSLRRHAGTWSTLVMAYSPGWRGLLGVRFGTERRARQLATMIRPGTLLIGHSDGCNLIDKANWHLASLDPDAGRQVSVVYLNPALDRDAPLAPNVANALVCHTRSDWTVRISAHLPGHPWGELGATGYVQPDPVLRDGRYINQRYEDMGINRPGHSGVFANEYRRARLMQYIRRFAHTVPQAANTANTAVE